MRGELAESAAKDIDVSSSIIIWVYKLSRLTFKILRCARTTMDSVCQIFLLLACSFIHEAIYFHWRVEIFD